MARLDWRRHWAGLIFALVALTLLSGCAVPKKQPTLVKTVKKTEVKKGPFRPLTDDQKQSEQTSVIRLEAGASASLVATLLGVLGSAGELSWTATKPQVIDLGSQGTMTVQPGARIRYEIGQDEGKFVFASPLPSVRAPAGPLKLRVNLESVAFKADNTAEASVDLGLGIKRTQPFRIAFDGLGDAPIEAEQPEAKTIVVTCYTASGCGPCETAKRELAAAKDLPFSVRFTGAAPAWVTSFPTFHWSDADGKAWQQRGWQGVERLKAAVTPPRSSGHAAPPATSRTASTGPLKYARQGSRTWSFSGGDTKAALIEHLINDRDHRGKFSRAWLTRLDRDSLVSLHSDDHEGLVGR